MFIFTHTHTHTKTESASFPELRKYSKVPRLIRKCISRYVSSNPDKWTQIYFRLQKMILSRVTRRNVSSADIFSRFVRLKFGHDSSDGWMQWILSEGSAKQSRIGWRGRWDPIIRQTRTPPPGFHSSTVYHMALSSWAPLTDNERRQPVQLQAKHSTFYRPKHVSGKLTVSIQFCSAFKWPITITFPWATSPPHTHTHTSTATVPSIPRQNKSWLLVASLWIQREWHLRELWAAPKRKNLTFQRHPFT